MWKLLLETTNPLSDPTIWVVLLLLVAMGGFMIFSSRRRKQVQGQVEKMLDELRAGQRVRTVGGVIGRIKEIREESPGVKTVLLQTGSDKFPAYMLFDIQAIYGVFAEEGHTITGQVIPAKEEKKEAEAKKETEAKKEPEAKKEESKDDGFKSDVFNAREYVNKASSSSSKSKKK